MMCYPKAFREKDLSFNSVISRLEMVSKVKFSVLVLFCFA